MAFFDTCPLCGANLDPGEACDCQEEQEQEMRKIQKILITGKGGQMQMRFASEVSKIAKVEI